MASPETLAFTCASLAALALPAAAQAKLRTFEPVAMQDDLFSLLEVLEREHGGLLRYATRDEIDEAASQAVYALEEELTAVEFHRVVAGLLGRIHCGHTRSRMPDGDRAAMVALRGLLPFEVCLRGERAWVLRTLGEDVPLEVGAELSTIDGWTIPEIRARAFELLPGDGHIEMGKERELERNFAGHFSMWLADPNNPSETYRVELAGSAEPIEVHGITEQEYAQRRTPNVKRPVVHLELRKEQGLGILSIESFGDPGGGQPSFPKLLAKSFQELADSGVGSLALDLRGNGGGNDMYGALETVSYLAGEPFGYFERIEVTEGYEGVGGIVDREGMRLVTEHPGTGTQQPTAPGFTGDVYILTDGWTFSTAADVATVAHHNGLATFLGEETGGGYDGNTSGSSERISLPNSGINVNVPHWMYTTANVGHESYGRGVKPDHPLQPSVEDLMAGRNVVLERVLELMAAK